MAEGMAHSIWLCPGGAADAELAAEIAELTRISGTDAFAPHVTLIGDLDGPPARTLELCRRHRPEGPVTARVTAVSATEAFFMALFLDVEPVPDLSPIRQAIGAVLGRDLPEYRPHLSLAYGHAPELGGAALHADLAARHVGGRIVLDRLCVVASTRHRPIREWQVLHDIPL